MKILRVRNESWTKWSDGVSTIVVPTLRAVLDYVALCCVECSFWRVGLDLGRGVAGNFFPTLDTLPLTSSLSFQFLFNLFQKMDIGITLFVSGMRAQQGYQTSERDF